MTEKEYYYNVELLKLLESIITSTPNVLNGIDYCMSYVNDLREKLDNMFDGEEKGAGE